MADAEPNFFTDPKRRDQPLRVGHVSSLLKSVALAMKEFFAKHIASRDARLQALEDKLAGLEDKGLLSYRGVWKAPERITTKDASSTDPGWYYKGECVTHDGSLWVCKVTHRSQNPQFDHAYWQLAVKKGRDAK